MEITRREWLGGALGLAAAGLARGREDDEASRAPSPPSAAWTKHGVVLEPKEPWEGDHIQSFTCPVEPLEDGRWRIWYSACGDGRSFDVGRAEGRPGEPLARSRLRRTPGDLEPGELGIGRLPDGWRPVQPVVLSLPDGRRRMYFWAHGPAIARYLVAESADGRSFRVVDPLRPVLWHPSDRAARGIPTPDGLVLTREPADRPPEEPMAEAERITNDSVNVYRLPDGSFELYAVALVPVPKGDPAWVAEDNAPGLVRVIDRLVSGDGLRFEGRRRVVDRDAGDPADQQFYHLAVTHVPRGRIGLLGHYRCRAQTMDLEWCSSNDGVRWHRPARGAWLARGEGEAPDAYGIYPPSAMVARDGRWHLFYTGTNAAHNGKDSRGKPRTVILHASIEAIHA